MADVQTEETVAVPVTPHEDGEALPSPPLEGEGTDDGSSNQHVDVGVDGAKVLGGEEDAFGQEG